MTEINEINDLINLIKNKEEWLKKLSVSELIDEFDKLIPPEREHLLKNEENWGLLEKGIRSYYFFKCMLKVAGVKLARRWFEGKSEGGPTQIKNRKENAKDWLEELIREDYALNLTPEIWKELTPKMKEYVIYYTFENFPGYYFRDYRSFPFPIFNLSSYIPSIYIKKLRSVIEESGDKEFIKLVDEMIEERKDAYKPLLIPYIPTRDERELIARVMDIFRRNGYQSTRLPEIYISHEIPPLFVSYPELEEDLKEKHPQKEEKESIIPKNRQRGRPETISIEELLGCYIPNSKIILYARGIKWFTRKYLRTDAPHTMQDLEALLQAVVLIHEIGHWVTHLLPKPYVPIWPTELYKLTSEEVHEGWAQLITWWVVEQVDGKIKEIFEELNTHQSHPYKVYEEFKSKNIKSVVNSLENLRRLSWPARLEDWRTFVI